MTLWECRGVSLSISLRTGIYQSHLRFVLKVDEGGGVWQVPAPIVLKKLQSGSVSTFLNVSNMSIPVLSWFPHCPQNSHSCPSLRGFSRWEEFPHLPHPPQGLFWMGRTTRGPSVPPLPAAQVVPTDNFNGSSFGLQFKFILKIPKTKSQADPVVVTP